MVEEKNKKLEYQERYRFWSDKRISQLSFHNNILLTLGFAVVGYFWSERNSVYEKLVIDCEADIDWKVVIFLVALIAVAFSIISGFILSLSRLYDLRLTSNITLTKKRALDKGINTADEQLSKSNFVASIKSLLCVFCKYRDYEITKEEIEDTEAFRKKFTRLRQKARDLGATTWGLVKWQTLSMLIAMLLFLLTMAVK